MRVFAASLGDLQNFCPSKTGFNDALVALMRGPSLVGPRCNRLDDRLILHYLMASGGASLRPFSGDCKRGTQVLFTLYFGRRADPGGPSDDGPPRFSGRVGVR